MHVVVVSLLACRSTSREGRPEGSPTAVPPTGSGASFPASPRFEPDAAVVSPTPQEAALLRSGVSLARGPSTRWEGFAPPVGFLADGQAVRRGAGGLVLAVAPDGSATASLLPEGPATPWITLSADRTEAWAASVPTGAPGTIALLAVGAPELGPTWAPLPARQVALLPLPTDPDRFALRLPDAALVRDPLAALPGGGVCLADREEVHCWSPGDADWSHPLDAAALAELPVTDDALAAARAWLGREPERWVAEIGALAPMPDDRVGVLVSISPVSGGSVARAVADTWVLAVGEDGVDALAQGTSFPIRTAEGLEPTGSTRHPLLGCDQLVWVDALDALGALCRGADHTWEDPDFGGMVEVLGLPSFDPQRWTGFGLTLIAPEGGVGWLPLTDAWLRTAECSVGMTYQGCAYGGLPRPFVAAGGALELVAVQEPADLVPMTRVDRLALVLDSRRFDPDGDQVPDAEERAAGTHPLRADSDGGGDDDGDELRGGTDPGDPGDDPVRRAPPPPTWTEVPWEPVEAHREALAPWDLVVGGVGAEGPLCAVGRCLDEGGATLGTWDLPAPTSFAWGAQKSLDGAWLAMPDDLGEDAVRFVHTGTGEVRSGLPRASLDALLPRMDALGAPQSGWNGLQVFFVTPDELWVVQPERPARVAVFDSRGDGRVVYDGEVWRCAAGFGPCDPGPGPIGPNLTTWAGSVLPGDLEGAPPLPPPLVDDLNPTLVRVWGYEPDAERLLALVVTTWGTHVLALHAERPAERWGDRRSVEVEVRSTEDPLLMTFGPVLERTRRVLGPGERLDETGRSTPQGTPLPGGGVAELPSVAAFGDRFGLWRFGDAGGVVLHELVRDGR